MESPRRVANAISIDEAFARERQWGRVERTGVAGEGGWLGGQGPP